MKFYLNYWKGFPIYLIKHANAKLFVSAIQASRYASLVIRIYYELRRSCKVSLSFYFTEHTFVHATSLESKPRLSIKAATSNISIVSQCTHPSKIFQISHICWWLIFRTEIDFWNKNGVTRVQTRLFKKIF